MSEDHSDWSDRSMHWLRVATHLVGINLLWILHTLLGGILVGA